MVVEGFDWTRGAAQCWAGYGATLAMAGCVCDDVFDEMYLQPATPLHFGELFSQTHHRIVRTLWEKSFCDDARKLGKRFKATLW